MPNAKSVMVRSLKRCLGMIRRARNNRGESAPAPAAPALSAAVTTAACAAAVEALEGRQFLSVSVVGGWTKVTPPSGAKAIYVSTSGNDGNSGTSPSSPVRSLAKAQRLMRSGAGDQMLLKRGDTFRESFGYWTISGKDSQNPALIGTYGSGARPVVATGRADALFTSFNGIHDLAIIGINLNGFGRGSAMYDGISTTGRVNNLLIEDCKIEGYRNNIELETATGGVSNVKVRRSVVTDSYSPGSHSQGLYADGVKGLLLEENVFDHNGWGHGAGMVVFNHGAYVTGKCSGLVATGNVFSNNSAFGLQARPGGTITNNLFVNNATHMSFGVVNGEGYVTAGGVSGTVSGNVFTGGHTIGGVPYGTAIEVGNVRGATISDNLFLNGDTKAYNPAILLTSIRGTANPGQAVGVNNLTVANNVVYGWAQGLRISGVSPNNLQVRNNDFQNIRYFQAVQIGDSNVGSWSGNRYYVPGNSKTPVQLRGRSYTIAGWKAYDSGAQEVRVGYPDSGRTLNGYAAGFTDKARLLSSGSWDTRYTAGAAVAYVKGGFRGGTRTAVPVSGSTPSPSPAPDTSTSTGGVSVSVGDASGTEGDGGYKPFTFTVRLSKASTKQVSVRWETKTFSAVVGKDYVGRNGTLTFDAGQTSKTITVNVIGDRTNEANEKFNLNLLSATNASLGDAQGVGTIVDDE
ncbi:MAG TPA: Calx-beta domain-containing protein [Humisphaera sp.]